MPRHLFVCTNLVGSGKPKCGVHGDGIVSLVQRELLRRRVHDVLVTPTGCLGPCFDGPKAVIYPEGVWYGALAETDATALVDHLVDGTVLEAKRSTRPGD